MIQDISPSRLDNAYKDYSIRNEDTALFFDRDGKILTRTEDGEIRFPDGKDSAGYESVYLFSVDETRFFLVTGAQGFSKDGFEYRTLRELHRESTGNGIYAAFTAYHLWKWYRDNRFCGACGKELSYDSRERALRCPACGNVVYPRINPAVIVGVIKGDCLLLTKYRAGYGGNALVAGFTEIGETLEETVAREVMEETGVRVRNIRYYKSQPWGIAQDILVGFYCDAEESAEIHMDENELRYAQWVPREEIVLQEDNLSLTNEMMRVFRENRLGI